MSDIASLAVGLHLNAANFKAQIVAAYKNVETQSKKTADRSSDDARRIEKSYRDLGNTVKSVTLQLVALAGVKMSIGAIIGANREYTRTMASLSAATKMTKHDIEETEKSVRALRKEIGSFDETQIVQSFADIAAARPALVGVAGGLERVSKAAQILAQATGTELSPSTQALTTTLNTFNGTAQDSERYINALVASTQQGPATIEELTKAMSASGEVATWSRVSYEQFLAVLQMFSRHGVDAGEGASVFKNALIALEKQTNNAIRPSIVGLDAALENLNAKHLTAAEASKLFGARNAASIGVLLKYRDEVKNITQAITGTDEAFNSASIMTNTLDGDLSKLSSTISSVVAKIGGSSNGSLRTGIQSVTESVEFLGENFRSVSDIATYAVLPLFAGRMTAGLQAQASEWFRTAAAAREAAKQQAATARATIQSAQILRAKAQADARHIATQTLINKQYGLTVSYQNEHIALSRKIREANLSESEAKLKLAAANNQLSLSSRAAAAGKSALSGALNLVGGPVGAAMLAGSALMYFANSASESKEKALALKDAIVETTESLMQLSEAQLNMRILDYQDVLNEQLKVQGVYQQIFTRLEEQKKRAEGTTGIRRSMIFSKDDEESLIRVTAELENVSAGAKSAEQQLNNAKKALVAVRSGIKPSKKEQENEPEIEIDPFVGENSAASGRRALEQFKQLRAEIEMQHAGSLQRIYMQEIVAQTKLIDASKEAGASQAEVQRLSDMIAEEHFKKRVELAEKHSPKMAIERQEKETNTLLKELYADRLLTQEQYQQAALRSAQDAARQRMQAEADAIAMPKMNMAGDVDPVVNLQNQLEQKKALYDAYYKNGIISKQQYEHLMIAETNTSTKAQQSALIELYKNQSDMHALQMDIISQVGDRMSNMITGVLTGQQTFKEAMQNMANTVMNTIVQAFIQAQTQALMFKMVSGFGGMMGGGPVVANAKGGVYTSPSLSAFSNQVVDSPTLFAFAKGAGLMGEAGPEAIMPLTRGPDGALGVKSIGGSGDVTVQQNITQHFSISGNGDAALQAAMARAAEEGARKGAIQAKAEIIKDFRTKGPIRRTLG